MNTPKMFLIGISVLIVIASLLGCRWRNDYSEKMKTLADRVLSSASDAPAALDELVRSSESKDHWQRYYALVYLGQIAQQNGSDLKPRILPIIIRALGDDQQATRRDMVCVIRDIGPSAVDQAIPELIQIVKKGEEIDVAWFAAEALGKVESSSYREEVIGALLNALDRPIPSTLDPSAPQLRFYALGSLSEIGRKYPSAILPEFEKRLGVSDKVLSAKIAKAAAELKR